MHSVLQQQVMTVQFPDTLSSIISISNLNHSWWFGTIKEILHITFNNNVNYPIEQHVPTDGYMLCRLSYQICIWKHDIMKRHMKTHVISGLKEKYGNLIILCLDKRSCLGISNMATSSSLSPTPSPRPLQHLGLSS